MLMRCQNLFTQLAFPSAHLFPSSYQSQDTLFYKVEILTHNLVSSFYFTTEKDSQFLVRKKVNLPYSVIIQTIY
jgi:hypothetical protein